MGIIARECTSDYCVIQEKIGLTCGRVTSKRLKRHLSQRHAGAHLQSTSDQELLTQPQTA